MNTGSRNQEENWDWLSKDRKMDMGASKSLERLWAYMTGISMRIREQGYSGDIVQDHVAGGLEGVC